MGHPFYGQNKDDNALDFALNASMYKNPLIVAGNNSQYGTAGAPYPKQELNRKIVNGHANGFDLFLPAISADDAGLWLEVDVAVANSGASIIITAATGDVLEGHAFITKATDAVANTKYFAADGTDLIITLNGTTTGGLIGSKLRLQVSKEGKWMVSADLNGSGTLATSFS